MDRFFVFVIIALLLHLDPFCVYCGTEHMVTVPESITAPLGFEILLECEMNVEPDKFEWKFYPTEYAYDPTAAVDFNNGTFHLIPGTRDAKQKEKSSLKLQVNSTEVTGDYQCVAYYGSIAFASIPWKVTIATLKEFPSQQPSDVTVLVGSTITWHCSPPKSNPEAYIEYYKNGDFFAPPYPNTKTKSLVIPFAESKDAGRYSCSATNSMDNKNSSTYLNLRVASMVPTRVPYFVVEPRNKYTVLKGETVLLECAAVGNPIPKVEWFKKSGHLPNNRHEILKGGLQIVNVSAWDAGTYICNHTNSYGTISHRILLEYHEEPKIDCYMSHKEVNYGENLDIECGLTGVPKPTTAWLINGYSVANDSIITAAGKRIFFRPVEKRHAGNLQLFAKNAVKTVSARITLNVVPLEKIAATFSTGIPHHRHRQKVKHNRNKMKTVATKLLPPGKPTITRLNNDSVMVHWSVPDNPGMLIRFFKVQYREVGSSKGGHPRNKTMWDTNSAEIAGHLRDFHVTGLNPDHIYRFRVASVYSNNDHEISKISDKFHLKKINLEGKKHLPIPVVTETESINTTAVRITWKCNSVGNITIDGFYLSYQSASTAGDYMKATIKGSDTTEFVISHLQSDTVYDVKLQSFNSKFASDFSSTVKIKTKGKHRMHQGTTHPPLVSTTGTEKAGLNLYVTVAGAIIGCALLICSVALIFVCRKWKQKKSVDNRHRSSTDNHHGSEYAVETMSIPRANGAVPNRITITSNPLADADNKNQNMIEMSRLQAQNNNCATSTSAAANSPTSGNFPESQASLTAPLKDNKVKIQSKEKNRLSAGEIV